jgi:hypothetical protein
MGIFSSANRNFVIAYVLLVALPLLGLAGVLRSGRGLVAPISVDGVWKFGADGANLPAGRCGKSLASLQDSLVSISQSGKYLVVSLKNGPPAAGSGVIDGTTLNATIPLPDISASEPGCGGDTMLALRATVTAKAESRSMQGTISVNECPTCSTMSYQAVRQTRSDRSRAH